MKSKPLAGKPVFAHLLGVFCLNRFLLKDAIVFPMIYILYFQLCFKSDHRKCSCPCPISICNLLNESFIERILKTPKIP